MNALARSVVVVAAVAAVALACTGCGTSPRSVAETSTTTPTVAPTPTATQRQTAVPTATPAAASTATTGVLTEGEPTPLAPGRYAIASGHWGVSDQLVAAYPRLSFTVPSGWWGNETLVGKTAAVSDHSLPFVWAWNFDHGYKDPCTDHTPVVPAAGSGAAGLLRVLAGESGIRAGRVTDVTVGGHAGAFVEYTVTTDRTTCGNGQDDLWIWGECPPPVTIGCEALTGGARYGANKGDRERAYAIDVDGTIYTFFTARPADLVAADRAELQRVLDSIEFEPAS
jgi:hypothetical protein